MHFTSAVTSAILAFATVSSATPLTGRTVPAPGLSLTAQLQLADSAADRFNLIPEDKDFVFNFNQVQKNAGAGGNLIGSNRKNFPPLVGTGASMAVGTVFPCGINTFHVHPRSAELQLVLSGRLITEMVPENGVLNKNGSRRVIRNELKPLMMTPFYQGSIHTQFNPDCENATFVAAFANEEAGTGQVLDNTFAMDKDILLAAFGQSIAGEDIEKIRKAIPASIAAGVDQCLKKCERKKNTHY